MNATTGLSMVVSLAAMCAVLRVPRASYYRALKGPGGPQAARSTDTAPAGAPAMCAGIVGKPRHVPRALTQDERAHVLKLLHEERFVDQSPAEVYATLLDEGRHCCSERTMYRILAANREIKERRRQRRHPTYAAPELRACRPNELWTWDITKLRGPGKGDYFHLYVMIDAYSRYVVGWMVADQELAVLAREFIEETCQKHGIHPDELTIHADRGTSMRSQPVALLLGNLGVIKSHSRPSVSNDNPFSESQFKTMKYRPDFPDRFGSLAHARQHATAYFAWYNTEHHHVGIGLLTPHDVHHGLAAGRLERRGVVLDAAYAAHPERFVQGPPKPAPLPAAVWINKPKNEVPPTELQQA